jgi:hypothetical protein
MPHAIGIVAKAVGETLLAALLALFQTRLPLLPSPPRAQPAENERLRTAPVKVRLKFVVPLTQTPPPKCALPAPSG